MSSAVKRRRGTTAQHAAFTGQLGEVTVDTDKKTLVVHDGVLQGGFPIRYNGIVRPEWFAQNVIPGTTDMAAAFASAITYAVANNIQTIELAADTYYLGSAVNFNVNARGWRITGKSMAGYLGTQHATKIKGANGLAALFLFSAAQGAVEIDHISFDGTSTSTGVVSAIKSTAEGTPARPFNIHHCHFLNFDKAIYSLLVSGGGNTGQCQMNIRENTFYVNNYALYGAGDTGSLMDVDFSGNVSEQGGKIKVLNGGAAGTWRIVSNLLEGQADAIDIAASYCHLIVESNYFESNTGSLVKFAATNASSSCFMRGNRIISSTTARVDVGNCMFVCDDKLDDNCYLSVQNLAKGSRFMQNRHLLSTAGTESNFANVLDLGMVAGHQLDLAALSGTLRMANAGSFENTAHGRRSFERFTTNSSTFSVLSSLSVNDWVIVTALVRQVNATAQKIVGIVYDNAVAYLNETPPMYPFQSTNDDGGWKLIHFGVKVSATSTGNYRVRFSTDAGGQVEVADFFAYKAAIPNNTTPIYIALPSSSKSGVATMPNGGTSVVVTHGMLVTPSNIRATAQANIGAVWVDTIGATQFTIKCASAPGADVTVMWDAN
jgi:hypothetical protein